ncbi:uncharacterized protein LOC131258837 [Anopheles coustani]|uniref:uncharacterized protein LOC131258837 n=1 Tax=Anopheles coustani TaxID=139045 RepID=UPI00265AA9DE|nr:uncharacterized protein LOC131258837 [Anopheles coustani]
MRNFPRLFLAVASLLSLGQGYEYQCEPGTDPTVCSLWNVQYVQNGTQLSVKMSSNVKEVRLNMEQYYYERHLGITVYDSFLHVTILHNPASVHVGHNRIKELHMPTDLQTGEFIKSSISKVHTNSSLSYAVTYLDLQGNSIYDISSLSALVNLQTLNLENNYISEINGTIFTSMRNLSMLYLGYNRFQKLDFKVFPKSLSNLWLCRNRLNVLDLVNVSLPSLTVLDVESNNLKTIDVVAVFAALPGLQFLPIAQNKFYESEAKRIIAELNRHNVSHYFGNADPYCDPSEYEVSKICFPGSGLIGRSVWKALMLLVILVILVAIFAGSVRWIWFQMRY